MAELTFLLLVLAVYALPVVLIVAIVSAIRKTPFRNGFIALGWSILVFLGAGIIASFLPATARSAGVWVLGALIAFLIARRGGYRLDVQSWILLLLLAPGWWLLFWRRSNKLWREAAISPSPAVATT